jgi:hypothetical protein
MDAIHLDIYGTVMRLKSHLLNLQIEDKSRLFITKEPLEGVTVAVNEGCI